MTEKEFEYRCRDGFDGVPITDDYTLWIKPYPKIKGKSVSVSKINEEQVYFVSIAEALEFVIDDGRKVKDIVETWTDMPDLVFDGPIIWHTK